MQKHVKRTRSVAVALVLTLALFVGTAAASPPTEYGARAYGMGGAYTGAADDIASLVYNPAGLAGSSFEISLGVGSDSLKDLRTFQQILDEKFGDDELKFGLSTLGGMSLGRFGVGVAADGSAVVQTDCSGGADLCAEADYMAQVLLGAAFDAAKLPLKLADLKLGASVARLEGRTLSHTRSDNGDGTYHGVTVDKRGQGFALNLGATFNASEIVSIGLAAQNVYSTITWTGTRTEGDYDQDDHGTPTETRLAEEKSNLPAVFRAGVAVRPPALGATLAADIASDGTLRFGVEKGLFLNAVNVRVGQIISEEENTTTAGIGFNLGPVHLNLAAGSSDGFKTVGTMIEGSVRF